MCVMRIGCLCVICALCARMRIRHYQRGNFSWIFLETCREIFLRNDWMEVDSQSPRVARPPNKTTRHRVEARSCHQPPAEPARQDKQNHKPPPITTGTALPPSSIPDGATERKTENTAQPHSIPPPETPCNGFVLSIHSPETLYGYTRPPNMAERFKTPYRATQSRRSIASHRTPGTAQAYTTITHSIKPPKIEPQSHRKHPQNATQSQISH